MKSYIKLPSLNPMPDSRKELRLLSDNEWKEYIFSYILKYYEVNQQEVVTLIETETKKNRAHIESEIKKHIKNWLTRKCAEFEEHEFKLNLEPLTECNVEGYYDLKFEHSQWHNKYFSFEAKNLGNAKSVKLSKSINEYVYVKEKDREDGGMYRYLNGKYACNMNFGGMIGFVIGRTENSIIEKLINKIYTVYDNNTIGMLTNDKIIKNSIYRNPNTFDSIHIRQNNKTKENEEFRLHHIIMDFVNSEN